MNAADQTLCLSQLAMAATQAKLGESHCHEAAARGQIIGLTEIPKINLAKIHFQLAHEALAVALQNLSPSISNDQSPMINVQSPPTIDDHINAAQQLAIDEGLLPSHTEPSRPLRPSVESESASVPSVPSVVNNPEPLSDSPSPTEFVINTDSADAPSRDGNKPEKEKTAGEGSLSPGTAQLPLGSGSVPSVSSTSVPSV